MRWLVAWNHRLEPCNVSYLQQSKRTGKVGASREGLVRLPDHHAAEVAFGNGDRFLQAIKHLVIDGMQFGLERCHCDVVAVVPQSETIIFENGFARIRAFTQHRIGEALSLVDG
jgi:hypothetical protein